MAWHSLQPHSKLFYLCPTEGYLSPLCSLGPVLSLCCHLHCARAACFRSHFPALLGFTHFHHLLAEKRATPVLYLDLKALYTYWKSTLGQFSGFPKYTGEFLPAALARGQGAHCWCRCGDAGKSIPNKQHVESEQMAEGSGSLASGTRPINIPLPLSKEPLQNHQVQVITCPRSLAAGISF